VAHVRYASGSAVAPQNTHPFQQAGRLFAHNGVIEALDRLDAELGTDRDLVLGDTDSERFFALITREIERRGDVAQGIASAVGWVAEHLPLFALNFVLIDAHELWALRYPDTHELHLLQRDAGGPSGGRHLEHASARGSVRVRSGDLATRPAVVVATEVMDEDPSWCALQSGELLHVAGDLTTTVTRVIDSAPAHLLTLTDLDPQAARSQQAPAHA
jgi:glutamine amidotransferase